MREGRVHRVLVPSILLGLAGLCLAPGAATGRAFLGVELEEETEEPGGGARITGIVEDSAAERAGLEEGDVIVEFDGKEIHGPMGLSKQIRAAEAGDQVKVTVSRDGKRRTVDVELGQRAAVKVHKLGRLAPMAPGAMAFGCDDDDEDCNFSWSCTGDDCDSPGFFGFGPWHRPLLGVELVGVTDELREHLGGEAGKGVLVGRVLSGSAAEAAGIQVGDLIVEVDGSAVQDAGELREELGGKQGKTFTIEVLRSGRPVSVQVTIPQADDVPTGPRARVLDLDELMDHVSDLLEQVQGAKVKVAQPAPQAGHEI
jgi:serine protease Do